MRNRDGHNLLWETGHLPRRSHMKIVINGNKQVFIEVVAKMAE